LRGWAENTDNHSQCFDLKWAVRSIDIDYSALLPGQIVNHFSMSVRLTTKVGLLHCLRDMRWNDDVDARSVFPRCYDLSMESEVASFEQVGP
jgi:hypothetical protein